MRVIVEGPDNSGKSTLIRHLHQTLGVAIVPGEGPARSTAEINHRVARYHEMDEVVFDRHPCISQSIYNNFRAGTPPCVDDQLMAQFRNDPRNLYIFCQGRSLDGHIARDVDEVVDESGQRHLELVNENHEAICGIYRAWSDHYAHAHYRIGDGFERITQMVAGWLKPPFNPINDIREFHEHFELSYRGLPRRLPPMLSQFRRRFMWEELNEYATHADGAEIAVFERDQADYAYHLEHMLDALVDEVYVVLGTSYLHGFDFAEAWHRVHEKNMMKVRATAAGPGAKDSGREKTFDIVKPAGWTPPSHIDLVEVNDLSSDRSSKIDPRKNVDMIT